jgi:streptogramin lyase
MGALSSFTQTSSDPEAKQTSAVSGPYGIITGVAGDGWAGYYGDGGPAAKAELHQPEGVVVDSAGNIYIADTYNMVVRKVTASNGQISTYAGTSEGGYAGDKGPATKALLYLPEALALDSAGDLYIADTGNNVVRKVSKTTGIITTVAGSGYGGGPDFVCGFGGDGGQATSAELCGPGGLAVDAKGNLYIADSSNNRVRRVDGKTGVITTLAGGGVLYGYSSEGVVATSVELGTPMGLALDGAGDLYITEFYICDVRKVAASTGLISTVAGVVTASGSDCSFLTQDGVPATSSTLYAPAGVAVDSAGNLFIASFAESLIRRVDAKSGIISTVAGVAISEGEEGEEGLEGYSANGGVATSAELRAPYGVTIGGSGNILIADTYNNEIRKVTSTPAAMAPAPSINPTVTFNGFGFASTQYVQLTDSALGATIYYTTDGTIPSTSSTQYLNEIELTKTSTITAFATLPSYANSSAVMGKFYLLPAPTISPNGGTFASAQQVTMSVGNVPASIKYTTDGSDPTISSAALWYYEPFTVSTSATVSAAAVLGGGYGPVSTAKFTVEAAPVAVTGSATNVAATSVTLNGTVNPGDLATKYWFTYSANCGTALKTAQKTLAASVLTETVTANPTGLTKDTSYCFQLFATNSKGTSPGQQSYFLTTY